MSAERGSWLRGTKSPNHKLHEGLVLMILEHPHVSPALFARMFRISRSVATEIARNKRWTWVHPEIERGRRRYPLRFWLRAGWKQRAKDVEVAWRIGKGARALRLLSELENDAARACAKGGTRA